MCRLGFSGAGVPVVPCDAASSTVAGELKARVAPDCTGKTGLADVAGAGDARLLNFGTA